jgi:hypothetical protein
MVSNCLLSKKVGMNTVWESIGEHGRWQDAPRCLSPDMIYLKIQTLCSRLGLTERSATRNIGEQSYIHNKLWSKLVMHTWARKVHLKHGHK